MDESQHCALSGEGAREFAETLENFDGICNPEDLKGDYPNQRIDVATPEFNEFANYTYQGQPVNERQDQGRGPSALDSVGAVAIDQDGRLACANSTG